MYDSKKYYINIYGLIIIIKCLSLMFYLKTFKKLNKQGVHSHVFFKIVYSFLKLE